MNRISLSLILLSSLVSLTMCGMEPGGHMRRSQSAEALNIPSSFPRTAVTVSERSTTWESLARFAVEYKWSLLIGGAAVVISAPIIVHKMNIGNAKPPTPGFG